MNRAVPSFPPPDRRPPAAPEPEPRGQYVGALVGESTSTGFRVALAKEAVREQDIIAVDARVRDPETGAIEPIRVPTA